MAASSAPGGRDGDGQCESGSRSAGGGTAPEGGAGGAGGAGGLGVDGRPSFGAGIMIVAASPMSSPGSCQLAGPDGVDAGGIDPNGGTDDGAGVASASRTTGI